MPSALVRLIYSVILVWTLDVPSDGDMCVHPPNAYEWIPSSTIDCRISIWVLRTL